MTLIAMSVGLSFLLLVLACRAAFAQTSTVRVFQCDVSELETVIDTFATLTGRAEDDYLLHALGRDDYARCRRARALMARKCLRHIGASAFLATALQFPREGEEIHRAHTELSKAAANARIAASFASTYLFLIWLFPRWMGTLPLRGSKYRKLLWQVRRLEESAERI